MITQDDIAIIAKAFTPVMKEYIAASIAEAIKTLPTASPINIEGIIDVLEARMNDKLQEAIAALPIPKDGRDGRDGRDAVAKDGRDGKDGEPGRDALAIEPLPDIDPQKSFPRGTWAHYRGGLWLARNVTSGLDGWENIIAGAADQSIFQDTDDPRGFVIETALSNGLVATKRFRLPLMIYRQIYQDGVDYQQGDVTTWHGNLWHCQVESTKSKPGTSTDWVLMVRAGRDGKDLREVREGAVPVKPVRLR